MFKDNFKGQTFSCTHENKNQSGICDACLGKKELTHPCFCKICESERYWQSCKGCGHHNTFWKTIVESKIWKQWKKYAEPMMLYDFGECEELGCMGEEHWKDFIKFIRK